jgi:hypothetical protein
LRIVDVEELQGLLAEYQKDSKKLISQIHEILWHMRSISREEAWSLSFDERKDILKQIEERVKLVETTKLPIL